MSDLLAPFTILGGATDYLLGAVAVGGQGAITGMGNVAPRVCCKAFELATKGDVAAAEEFAGEISRAEWALGKGGVVGTKVSFAMGERIYADGLGSMLLSWRMGMTLRR
jgi:dihydrodipicolinate synthase/N-acetylneuraminate lyase